MCLVSVGQLVGAVGGQDARERGNGARAQYAPYSLSPATLSPLLGVPVTRTAAEQVLVRISRVDVLEAEEDAWAALLGDQDD